MPDGMQIWVDESLGGPLSTLRTISVRGLISKIVTGMFRCMVGVQSVFGFHFATIMRSKVTSLVEDSLGCLRARKWEHGLLTLILHRLHRVTSAISTGLRQSMVKHSLSAVIVC